MVGEGLSEKCRGLQEEINRLDEMYLSVDHMMGALHTVMAHMTHILEDDLMPESVKCSDRWAVGIVRALDFFLMVKGLLLEERVKREEELRGSRGVDVGKGLLGIMEGRI